MSVRKKIALLITAAGFLSSLVFSIIILWEALEQPIRMIDSELDTVSQRTVALISKQKTNQTSEGIFLDIPLFLGDDRYWLKVYNPNNGQLIYQSHLGKLINIIEPAKGSSSTVSFIIPKESINLEQNKKNKVSFRIKKTSISIDGKSFIVCAARPIEKLEEEIWDIVISVTGGLGFSIVLLMAISYFVAGLILKPIREMNEQALDITEKHLDRRIPVSGGSDEFNTLAQTLNQVFERLQHAFIRQKQFLADASHELKTPLTTMRLALDTTRSTIGKTLPTLQGKTIVLLTEQVLRMEKLVKNLLDLSALEIQTIMKKDRVDLRELINSLIEDYHFLIEQNQITISFQDSNPLFFFGDSEKLSRALSNLIDNAIKYNVKDGRIKVTTESSEKDIIIILGNTGPGVSDIDIHKIFDQFYRVEQSRSLQHGGSGLGLAIVKRIIELHNGTITFESTPGTWTWVTISLPRHQKKPLYKNKKSREFQLGISL